MAISIDEVVSQRKLVGISNGEVWWEMSAGAMIELNTASGAIDTSDQLRMFEAFQKVFVVNGSNLKVADFINIKLVHAELTTPHAKGDILTQDTDNTMVVDFTNTAKTATYGTVIGGTFETTNEVTGSGSGTAFTPTGINGMLTHAALTTAHAADDTITQATTAAEMVVEFTDATKTHTWGRITTGTFNTTNEVTGSGSGSAFTPTATDTSPPLWYDWTVYQGDSTNYGSIPDSAYLGCLYRGRLVLAADPIYPHQWYMSKIGDPWNWLYVSTDPLTAVAGNNADAGEMGDIIRALIPYKDDYLIFGCASSLWLLTGDPAGGGTIDSVDLTVGMYGADSWCFDGKGNLYFFGTGGIYKSPLGFRSVENLTIIDLPNLIDGEDVDPTTHRITMVYDRKRYGLVITITKLVDGSNSNYWYDLKFGGFFPESYPDECGAYSAIYYAANDNDYADVLLGCTDGYIRKYSDSSKDDSTGASSTDPISSYVVLPIVHLSEDNDSEGKLTSLTFELAGGAAGGAFSDTDAVTYEIFIGDDPETVLEKTKPATAWATGTVYSVGDLRTYSSIEYVCVVAHTSDNSGPPYEAPDTNVTDWETAVFASGTLTGGGRKYRIRTRVRGAYIGIKLSNVTASETWAINRVFGNVQPAGKIKG